MGRKQVTLWKASLLLVGYCGYVAVVCAADMVHRLRSSATFSDSRPAAVPLSLPQMHTRTRARTHARTHAPTHVCAQQS